MGNSSNLIKIDGLLYKSSRATRKTEGLSFVARATVLEAWISPSPSLKGEQPAEKALLAILR
jgi:hypothetical protein